MTTSHFILPPTMHSALYVMDEEMRPRRPESFEEWAEFMRTVHHIVQTQIGPIWVSTIFLGLDALGNGYLYETMIAITNEVEYKFVLNSQKRYRTVEAARAGHQEMCEYVQAILTEMASKITEQTDPLLGAG